MWQNILVLIIVCVILFFAIRSLIRTFSGKSEPGCKSGGACCSEQSSCPSAQSHHPKE